MRFQTFASGSSGNCTYIGSDAAHILVDVGISRKRIYENLTAIGLDFRDLDGILITHEHSDHIGGLPMILKKSEDIPIYASAGTIRALLANPKVEDVADPSRFIAIEADTEHRIGDLVVNPMRISHDAAEPYGYRITCGDKKACVCTDLGTYTDYTVEALQGSDVLLLEANHDVNMLQVGPYPYHLKQRILSDRGHLSNLVSGELLTKVLNDHMQGILLGHLSQENNYPDLAYQTVRIEVAAKQDETGFYADELPIAVADRKQASRLIEF